MCDFGLFLSITNHMFGFLLTVVLTISVIKWLGYVNLNGWGIWPQDNLPFLNKIDKKFCESSVIERFIEVTDSMTEIRTAAITINRLIVIRDNLYKQKDHPFDGNKITSKLEEFAASVSKTREQLKEFSEKTIGKAELLGWDVKELKDGGYYVNAYSTGIPICRVESIYFRIRFFLSKITILHALGIKGDIPLTLNISRNGSSLDRLTKIQDTINELASQKVSATLPQPPSSGLREEGE